MEIVNISADKLFEYLKYDNSIYDYYRKGIDYDDDNYFGLYYKDFHEVINDITTVKELEDYLEYQKDLNNKISEWPWEHRILGDMFGKICRINDAQKEVQAIANKKGIQTRFEKSNDTALPKVSKMANTPVISALVLCNNYPVGILFPKKISKYYTIGQLEEAYGLSLEDKKLILDRAQLWVNSLVARGVFPTLYSGNIVVNPYDYSDVILDGLDGPSVCRVENNSYVKTLAGRGLDLRNQAYNDFNKLKDSFLKKNNSRSI